MSTIQATCANMCRIPEKFQRNSGDAMLQSS